MANYYRLPVLALCPDGKVRKVQARHCWDGQRFGLAADTVWTVPAGVAYGGRHRSGVIVSAGLSEGEELPGGAQYVFHDHSRPRRYLAATFRADGTLVSRSEHDSPREAARRLASALRQYRPDYGGALDRDTGRILSIHDLEHDTSHADYPGNRLRPALLALNSPATPAQES